MLLPFYDTIETARLQEMGGFVVFLLYSLTKADLCIKIFVRMTV